MDSLRVGVTAARKGAQLATLLRRRGAAVVHEPTVGSDQPVDPATLVADSRQLLDACPRWFAASTGVGMRLWADTAERHGLLDAVRAALGRAGCVARGPKAVGGLRRMGVEPLFVSPRETDADVASWLAERARPGEVVGVQRHGTGGTAYDRLADAGVTLVAVQPYRTGAPAEPAGALRMLEAVLGGRLDVVTFTSAPAARGLFAVADDAGRSEAFRAALTDQVAVAVVGPVTAEVFAEREVPVAVAPTRARTADLVDAVVSWWQRQGAGARPAPGWAR